MTSATPIAPRDGHYHERVDTACGGHYAVSAWPADDRYIGHAIKPDIRIYAQEGGDFSPRELAMHRVNAAEARKLAAVLLAAAEVADPTPALAVTYEEWAATTLPRVGETVTVTVPAPGPHVYPLPEACKRELAAEVDRLYPRCGHCGELSSHFGCEPDDKHPGYWLCQNASDS